MLRILLFLIRNGPTIVISVSCDSFSFTVTTSTYTTTERSCLVSKYVSILEKQQDGAMGGHPCIT